MGEMGTASFLAVTALTRVYKCHRSCGTQALEESGLPRGLRGIPQKGAFQWLDWEVSRGILRDTCAEVRWIFPQEGLTWLESLVASHAPLPQTGKIPSARRDPATHNTVRNLREMAPALPSEGEPRPMWQPRQPSPRSHQKLAVPVPNRSYLAQSQYYLHTQTSRIVWSDPPCRRFGGPSCWGRYQVEGLTVTPTSHRAGSQ